MKRIEPVGNLEPLRVPMDAIRAAARAPDLERVLVVGSERRSRDLVELRDRVVQKWPDRVYRGDIPEELVVDTGRRFVVLRTIQWPRDFIDWKWRADLVVVDMLLPFSIVSRLRASPRRESVSW